MPAEESSEERRGRPLLTILFWIGVGLAPLAALLLLLAQGNGPLRIAAVLAILAVVLIGVSITLRGDAESVRLEMEESILEDIEDLRADLRKDIETAARATHKAFGEKLQVLQNELWSIRAQHGARAPGTSEAAPSGAAGAVRAPSAGAVPGPTRPGPGGVVVGAVPTGGVVGPGLAGGLSGAGPVGGSAGPAREAAGAARLGAGVARVRVGSTPQPAPPRSSPNQAADTAGAQWRGSPAGGRPDNDQGSRAHSAPPVVRHTETVRVTTRQTIVGPAPEDQRGNVYGAGRSGADPAGGGPHGAGASGGGRYGAGASGGGRYGTAVAGGSYPGPERDGWFPDGRREPSARENRAGAHAWDDGHPWQPEHDIDRSAHGSDPPRHLTAREQPRHRADPPGHDFDHAQGDFDHAQGDFDHAQGEDRLAAYPRQGARHQDDWEKARWRDEAWDGGAPAHEAQFGERADLRYPAAARNPGSRGDQRWSSVHQHESGPGQGSWAGAENAGTAWTGEYDAGPYDDRAARYDAGPYDDRAARYDGHRTEPGSRFGGGAVEAVGAYPGVPGPAETTGEEPHWSGRYPGQSNRVVSGGGRHGAPSAESGWPADGAGGGGSDPDEGWYRDAWSDGDQGRHGFRPEPPPGRRRHDDAAVDPAAGTGGVHGDDIGGERYGYPPSGDVPRAGGARPLDVRAADTRWR